MRGVLTFVEVKHDILHERAQLVTEHTSAYHVNGQHHGSRRTYIACPISRVCRMEETLRRRYELRQGIQSL